MTTVRQPCSMPQSGWTSGESRCLARQTGWSAESGLSSHLLGGNISFIRRLKPSVESPAAATGLGEDEAPCST